MHLTSTCYPKKKPHEFLAMMALYVKDVILKTFTLGLMRVDNRLYLIHVLDFICISFIVRDLIEA